jgi:general stress protein YciG
MAEKKKGKMTVSEAGHKGGEATARTHGHEYYHEIGEKGGHKGGEKTAETHGHEFYEKIGEKGGHIGGEHTAETHGHEFYEKIGHKGGQKVKELIEKGKESEEGKQA